MNDVIRLLGIVGDFISKLSKTEVEDLLNRRSRLVVEPSEGTRKTGTAPKRLTDQEVKEILYHLNLAPTREDGIEILDKNCRTRSRLVALARAADLPVQKRDKVLTIRDRIIEATIGYRLRSRAIRGTESLHDEL